MRNVGGGGSRALAAVVLGAAASCTAVAALASSVPRPLPSLAAWIRDARFRGAGDVRQRRRNDCGPAALAHALRELGLSAPYPDPASTLVLGPRGCGLEELGREAERRGVAARLRRLDPGELARVTPPAVLHLVEGHFVVFDGTSAAGDALLFDPSLGCLEQTPRGLARHWSGYVLELSLGRRDP